MGNISNPYSNLIPLPEETHSLKNDPPAVFLIGLSGYLDGDDKLMLMQFEVCHC